MPTPLVSIILPTHNGRKDWLSLAIESVLQQSFEDFELIIIDDASTTTISETIRTYCAKDSRIVFVQNKENLKLTKTLNKGISLAQGKYIARIDDDDIRSDPEKLANQVLFMENNPEYVLCGCSIQVINEHDELGGKVIALSSDAAIRCNFLENNPFFHSSVCIRKSALDQVGYYDSAYDFAEDYELWARLGKVGLFYNFADIFIHYRIAMHSVSRQKEWKQKKVSYQIYRRYRKDYPLAWIPLVRKFLIYLVPRNLLLSLLPLSFLLWIRSKLSAQSQPFSLLFSFVVMMCTRGKYLLFFLGMMIFLNFSQSLGFSLSGSSDPLIFQQQFFGFPSWATGHTYDLSTDTSYQKFLDTTHPFNTVRYQPQDLAPIPSDFTFNAARKFQLREEAGIQFADMAWHFQHVFQGKKRLSLTSAYRSYAFQERLNKNCRANQCAEAGTSEHQAGLAVDLGVNGKRLDLKSLNRLEENAHKWGFHQTYQKGVSIDGKIIEPWHWRYLGIQLATELYDKKMSFAERFYAQESLENEDRNTIL